MDEVREIRNHSKTYDRVRRHAPHADHENAQIADPQRVPRSDAIPGRWLLPNWQTRQTLIMAAVLVSTEVLNMGDEITWNYGRLYQCTYKAGCASAPPAGSGEMIGELAEELYMLDGNGRELFRYGADVDDTSDDE